MHVPNMVRFPALALLRAELLRSLRGVKAFAFMGLLMLVGTFTVWANISSNYGSPFDMARAANEIFLFFAVIVSVSAGLFIPAMAATAIVGEREEETFDLLTLTLIPQKTMVLAKLSNVVGLFMLVVLGVLPVLASVFFLVGLDVRQVLFSVAVIFVSCISADMIGLAASAYCRKTLSALILAYLVTAFLMGGHDFLIIVAQETLDLRLFPGSVNAQAFYDFAGATSPPMLLAGLYEGWCTDRALYWAAYYHGGIIFGALIVTISLLRRGPRPPQTDRGQTRWLPRWGRRARPIPNYANAIVFKELRWGMLRTRSSVLLGLLSAAVFLTIHLVTVEEWNLYSHQQFDYDRQRLREALITAFAACMPLVLFAVPVFITNLFTKERETHNLDMLRVCLLRPWQLVAGKTIAGARAMLCVLIPFVLTFVVYAYPIVRYGHATILVKGFVTTAVSVLFLIGLSAYTGAASRRTATGLVAAYGIGLVVFAGLPLLLLLLVASTGSSLSGDIEFMIAGVSPYVSWLAHVVEADVPEAWQLVMVCYTLLGVALLLAAIPKYARDEGGA